MFVQGEPGPRRVLEDPDGRGPVRADLNHRRLQPDQETNQGYQPRHRGAQR